jgi:hypothetical protein
MDYMLTNVYLRTPLLNYLNPTTNAKDLMTDQEVTATFEVSAPRDDNCIKFITATFEVRAPGMTNIIEFQAFRCSYLQPAHESVGLLF